MLIPILISYVILILMMAILWFVFRRINNAAIVDFGWGFGFVLVGLVYLVTAPGLIDRRIFLTFLMAIWGGRLAWHLLKDRILSGKPEDGRYQDIRARWKEDINRKFFAFFQFQALLIVLFSIPMLFIASNTAPAFSTLEWVGVGIWALGVIGETISDLQLKRFKDNPSNKGRTCQGGLWRYSRHPNYFFEWVIWIAFFVIGLSMPYGWIGIISPLGMLYILLRVTGISLTEEHALRTRGEEYKEYQRTTSAFVPLPRRRQQKATIG